MNEQSNIVISGRHSITVTGVSSVDTFDEECIVASLYDTTTLCIEGEGMSIKDVNLEKGILEASGLVTSLYYLGEKRQKSSFLKRVFGR